MKFFIDTANIEEIKEVAQWGVLSGVTTNPSLIAKEGRDFKQVVKEITELVDGDISAEVTSYDAENMIIEGRNLSKISKNIVVKIPMTTEGLRAISILSNEGIKTNCTLIFSVTQAMLAANAGATYVSPFIGRIDDIGYNGMQLIEEIMEVFNNYGTPTEVIAASVRNVGHVRDAALVGCDIATIPYKVFISMEKHPLTDKGIENFKKDWDIFLEGQAK
ncbi:MAG: fructose-6-phosphate aldolase [Ezakiella sp.]|nr:fructose-6-phosphate aldolase [Ezakiella sp.]MDD7471928.1 fructose-6-phosphate aldolase [Bacillota bacterium]MDY3923892.1 fructose-6-phosphate aldolase [Ezakiella sp.]